MPRELITLQVGQCGNQIGTRFWDEARAVLVDMEEGVINSVVKSPLGGLFDARSMLSDVSGAGNNWAHGHHVYGPQYGSHIMDLVQAEAEQCDSLQGFLLMHSLGGGTGSGLGTYLLSALEDCYPELLRFAVSLFPSDDDDVVTSPYNSLLSLHQLIQHADAVLPIENQALHSIVDKVDRQLSRSSRTPSLPDAVDLISKGKKPYDRMNNIAARVVLNMTSGMRFEGNLNVDLNDITMNMVPFPRHHFLVPAMSPLVVSKAVAASHRAIDHLFHDVMRRENQLISCDPRSNTYLACGLFARGSVTASDVSRNITTMRPNMKLAYWNEEGFKVGLCSIPPMNVQASLLFLGNNCCISDSFSVLLQRFERLFRRRMYVHHYTKYMDVEGMSEAKGAVQDIIEGYRHLNTQAAPDVVDIYKPLGLGASTNDT